MVVCARGCVRGHSQLLLMLFWMPPFFSPFSCFSSPSSPPSWSQLPLLSHLWPQPKAKVGRLLLWQHGSPVGSDCWPQGARSNHDNHNLVPSAPCQLVHEYHLEREKTNKPNWCRIDGLTGGWTDSWMKEQKEDACATERTSFRNEFWWPIDPLPLFQFKKEGVIDLMLMGINLTEVALRN